MKPRIRDVLSLGQEEFFMKLGTPVANGTAVPTKLDVLPI
jgi:hypothetical protein